jgi:hypothetical protein
MFFPDEMTAALPAGMSYPPELLELFAWMDAQGFVQDAVGMLGPHDSTWFTFDEATGTGTAPLGTELRVFPTEGPWGALPPERVHAFAQSGADGSRFALFRDDAGDCRVVHLGSGSGSTWYGCVGATPLDFLRLLAVGYTELSFPEEFARSPADHSEIKASPNMAYRAWLRGRFGVAAPATGAEICPADPCMDDAESNDPFWRYFDANRG